MGIKRYILLTLVYVLAIGLYVYSFNGDYYALDILGVSLNLPIALWIIIPVVVLFISTILHLIFYNFKDFLHQRSLKKDFEMFKELSKLKVLGEKSITGNFRSEGFKAVGEILSVMKFDPASQEQLLDEELVKIVEVVKSIYAGNYVELKKYKLDKDNPLFIQNTINRLSVEPKYAYEILKTCKDTSSDLCLKAYDALLDIASFNEIKRYDFSPDKRTFRRMMERHLDADDSFDMDIKSIEDMLEQFNADRADYLELAREIKVKLSPDALIALFEKLYNTKGSMAADAYLYVLYDLQMIDKIRDILDNSDNDEFVKFKTVLFLRDHGKSIDIDTFLRA